MIKHLLELPTLNHPRVHILYVLLVMIVFFSCSREKNISEINSGEKQPLFELVSDSLSNVNFGNYLTETDKMNMIKYHYFYNGGGVACGDINNDGLVDLFFTANQLPDKLYLNKGGLKFEDISENLPNFLDSSWSTGVTMADVNADGFLDIYVCKSGKFSLENRKNLLLINDGKLKFTEQAAQYGLDDPAFSTQAAFFDYDKDGDLDMYLLNHEIKYISNYNRQIRATGRDPYIGDKLYRNDNNQFKEVGQQAGIFANPYGFGLGVAVGDLNGDQWPDIYVTNDFVENDYLYYNNKDGTFTESIKNSTQHISNFGMGVDISDINNDGMQDILVVDMVAKDNFRQKTNMSGMNPEKFWETINFGIHYQYMVNTLQVNQGSSKFSEVGQMAGISNTDWSWAPLITDLDNDGYKDIFVSNGLRKEIRNNDFVSRFMMSPEYIAARTGLSKPEITRHQLLKMPSKKISNCAFQNQQNLKFEDKAKQWGLDNPTFSTGAAYADLDNDGDLDLILNNVDEKAQIYQNKSNKIKNRNYISIRLVGSDKNLNGIGARIIIRVNDNEQVNEIYSTRGFQSSVPLIAHFGLADENKVSSIKVLWPDGKVSDVQSVKANQLIEINYADATNEPFPLEKENIRFQDVTALHDVDFRHIENYYDDFKDQVLLPHKLSNPGPALAIGDINNDGLEDFYVGGSKGYSGYIFKQLANGKFLKSNSSFNRSDFLYEDVDATFFDVDGDQDLDLYVASGSYEFDSTSKYLHDRLYVNDGNGNFSLSKSVLPDIKLSTACVKPADIDNDGDIDLFIGGRVFPKHYPLTPKSYLLINNDGKLMDETLNIAPELNRIGMVTDAEWVDIDQDGNIDLIVAGEWMPINIFKGSANKFILIENENNGLEKSNGWWYSLQKLDYDADGDMDIVAGNLGLNYKYKASSERPFKVFSDDFDNNQSTDIILSYSEDDNYYPVRGRECSSEQMPFIKEKFPDYKSFGLATIDDVIGPNVLPSTIELNAYTFSTTLFENKGNQKFKPIPLSFHVQLSSINDIVANDLNNDGKQDLIMAGNLLSSEVETPRNDAGYGSILLGKDSKKFEIIPASQLEFFGEGEVKKIRPIRIGNKYTAYIVALNNGPLKIYRFE